MINSNLYALIMAGGHGTRFWPESTRSRPKQFLSLYGDRSLLAQTFSRFEGLVAKQRRFLITTEDQANLALECMEGELSKEQVILEPAGRNTAPCILLSLAALIEKGAKDEDVVIISPADHAIIDTHGLQETLRDAFELAVTSESIVTIGIPPHCPHTGYGYIHRGQEVGNGAYSVQSFKEKPDQPTAEDYLATGEYYWNAGMFVSRIDVFLEQFKECAPELFVHFRALRESSGDPLETAKTYQQLSKISIDYAVMEKTKKTHVVPARFDWSDLGSWDALTELYQKTSPESFEGSNLCLKALGLYSETSQGNLVWAPEQIVALIGVDDLIVVSTGKHLLVMNKADAQKVKNAVDFFSTHPKLKDYV